MQKISIFCQNPDNEEALIKLASFAPEIVIEETNLKSSEEEEDSEMDESDNMKEKVEKLTKSRRNYKEHFFWV